MENKIIVVDQDQLMNMIKSVVAEAMKESKAVEDQSKIMNFKETCSLLGIHSSTLNKWKAANKIPFKRLGKRIFFNREEVLKSLQDSNYKKYMEITRAS